MTAGEGEYRLSRGQETEGEVKTFGSLRSRGPKELWRNWALMIQRCEAAAYRGRRVEFRARLRTREAGRAALFFSVEGAQGLIAMDHMHDRLLRGDGDWQEVSCVLDVPAQAKVLVYGAMLVGGGELDVAEARLRPVQRTRAITGLLMAQQSPESWRPVFGAEGARPKPMNLDFSL